MCITDREASRRLRFRRCRHRLQWAAFFLAVAGSGCSSLDSPNTSARPWNGPTRSDQSQGWWFHDEYTDPSHGLYP